MFDDLKKSLPEQIKIPLKYLRTIVRKVIYFGNKRFCPVCEKTSGKFIRAHSRNEALCAHCNSLERHRFVWHFFKEKTELFRGNLSMLHVAPEEAFTNRLKQLLGNNYITADLDEANAMIKMDIMNIQYPDYYFDVIYCSHVLEHVPDDKKAMKELFRVLKQKGWAVLMVPVNSETTIEDPSVTDPSKRLKLFGQEDHVRIYGNDFTQRLEQAGFKVKVISPADIFAPEEMIRTGTEDCTGDIFFCTKD